MHVVVCYDISDAKIRQTVFGHLKEKGIHTQKSIFECEMDAETLQKLAHFFEYTLNPETDSALLYPLCGRCARSVRILGQGIEVVRTDWEVL